MGGWLNGEFVAALPDMVSDLMLMSRAYARERGFYINDDPGYQVLFEYGDRSRAYTTGLVEGVEWVFGDLDGNDFGRTQNCSFLVVDDLTCDVIFSDDFLFTPTLWRRWPTVSWSFGCRDVFECHQSQQSAIDLTDRYVCYLPPLAVLR